MAKDLLRQRCAQCGDAGRATQALLIPSLRPVRLHLKLSAFMGISQPQNLTAPMVERQRPYGVRVSLPPGDPFRKILGPEWHRLHWYPSPAERDAALAEMSRRHQYSRAGDRPSLVFDKVENLAESRGL
ncbi:MAG: hypothetical protein ACYDAE_01005 [Steroidobacteraceae bacterium]